MFPFNHGSHEFIKRSSRLDDLTVGPSRWCQEADWDGLRTTAHCENAILPIGSLPGFPGGARREPTESATGRADRPRSRVWGVYRAMLSSYQMRPASRDIRMAQAIKFVVGQGLLTLAGLSAARRVSSWIRIATQRGMLVVMRRDEDLDDPAENEFLQD